MVSWTDIKRMKATDIKKKRVEKLKLFFAVLFVLIACLFVNYERQKCAEKKAAYESTLDSVQKDIKEEEERTDEILDRKAYIQTKKFAEDVARYYGLVYPDDTVFEAKED